MAALKPFAMPKWGIEMTEGTVAEWQVEEGKPFSKGDVIVLIETDKITNEVEAEADGCLVRILAGEQDTKKVGSLLAVMGPPDAEASEIEAFIASYKPSRDSGDAEEEPSKAPAPTASSTASPEPSPAPVKRSTIAKDVAISPRARFAAEAAGLSVSDITPSGRHGRITKQDVDKAIRGSRTPDLKGPIEVSGQEEVFASPLARRIAAQNGVDLTALKGTGPRGRICKADVLGAMGVSEATPTPAAPPVDPSVTVEPMTSMRKTIARRLTEAKQAIPHIYLRRRVRADAMMALREEQGKPGTINDYVIRASALALQAVPKVNVQVHEGAIHHFTHADISMAVATDRGLITPIITKAETRSVADIAAETKRLAERAREGKLRPEEFQGGSFSISNLGGFGVDSFDAVINPPQGAILAVGKARNEAVDVDGELKSLPVMHLSLSCDHRAIDGVDGAQFLEALAKLIENPGKL